mgnify:CR=1 FL=1
MDESSTSNTWAIFSKESIAILVSPRSNCDKKPMERPVCSLRYFNVYFFFCSQFFDAKSDDSTFIHTGCSISFYFCFYDKGFAGKNQFTRYEFYKKSKSFL